MPAKVKPDFNVSGKLYAEVMTNANGVVSKYAEPADAAKPDVHWRIYVFKKGEEGIQLTLHLHRQQKYAIGRDPKVRVYFLFRFVLCTSDACSRFDRLPTF